MLNSGFPADELSLYSLTCVFAGFVLQMISLYHDLSSEKNVQIYEKKMHWYLITFGCLVGENNENVFVSKGEVRKRAVKCFLCCG